MSINLERERPISFNEAAKYLPKNYRPHLSTWWRWHRHGIKGVRLETVVVGGRRYTTAEAVQRFAAALTSENHNTQDLPPEKPVRASLREVEKRLDAIGIC
jgi:hypothetical protein